MWRIIDKLRQKVADYLIHREIKIHPHFRVNHTLSSAKTCGIIIDVKDEKDLLLAKSLGKELAAYNISCKYMGYINSYKRNDNYIGDETYCYACKKDFTFFYRPKKNTIQQFVNEPFDILIVLTNKPYYPVYYASLLSQAAYKVGKAGLSNDVFDVMIDLKKENNTLPELKNNILHYLKMINEG